MIFATRAVRPSWVLPAFVVSVLALQACDAGNRYRSAGGDRFPLPALVAMATLDDRRAELGDKILLINIWATWCSPCRREMPDLQGLSDTLGGPNFAVIGISIDDDANLAREFLLQNEIRFTNFHDPGQALSAGQLGIQTLPATYIVAADGGILLRVDGMRTWNRETLRELLGHRFAEISA